MDYGFKIHNPNGVFMDWIWICFQIHPDPLDISFMYVCILFLFFSSVLGLHKRILETLAKFMDHGPKTRLHLNEERGIREIYV